MEKKKEQERLEELACKTAGRLPFYTSPGEAMKARVEFEAIILEALKTAQQIGRESLERALQQATTEVQVDDFEEGEFWIADQAKFSTKDERPDLWEWLMRQPVWINTKAAHEHTAALKDKEVEG